MGLTVFCMLVVYIAQIKSKLRKLLDENINLFNKMHEGLIIFSKADLNLVLASKPALELIEKAKRALTSTSDSIRKAEDDDLQNKTEDLEEKIKNTPLFKPTKVSVQTVENVEDRSSIGNLRNDEPGLQSIKVIIDSQLNGV